MPSALRDPKPTLAVETITSWARSRRPHVAREMAVIHLQKMTRSVISHHSFAFEVIPGPMDVKVEAWVETRRVLGIFWQSRAMFKATAAREITLRPR